MFTGIVQTVANVRSVRRSATGANLIVDRSDWHPASLAHGDSVLVDGVCLTVTAFDEATVRFDVVHETLSRSTLGKLKAGSRVNLESSLTPSTPIGGHFVQGHVDVVGQITHIQSGDDWRLTVRVSQDQTQLDPQACLVPKGSVAIQGVSLTIAALDPPTFTVALIPTTLNMTNLKDLHTGDAVNVELDILAKTVVNLLYRQGWQPAASTAGSGKPSSPSVTMDDLRNAGFG